MFESRCGVCCNQCQNKEKWGCTGCLNMSKPTWGDCEVKACCELRKIDFCGQCEEFPCKMLSTMGVEYGYDPMVKINQCRVWMCEKEGES